MGGFMRTAKLLLRACSVSSFALLLLAGAPLHAQAVNDGNATGFPPFRSFHGSDFDLVSLQNGNLHIDIPFAKVPRRGGGFTYRFVYDTPTWELNASRPTPTSNYLWLAAPSSEVSGWRVPPPANWGIRYAVVQENCTYQGGVASDGTPTYVTGQYEVRSMWTLLYPEGT